MIKKLSPEERAALPTKKLGKMHPARIAINNMEAGEALQISRSVFTWKNVTPRLFCNQISKKTKKRFEVSALLNNSGWVVERLPDNKAGMDDALDDNG
jgi:hypothetical protein